MLRMAPCSSAALLLAAALAASTLAGCGGRQVPDHDGYRDDWSSGWIKPKVLAFDEDFEAEDDGDLSYPKRRRARWYAVDLPGDGTIEIKVISARPGALGDGEELEDPDDPFDVAFEIYDRNYRLVLRADNQEEDAGDRDRVRTTDPLAKGRYFVHLYLQRRLDEAEYTVRLRYNSGALEPMSDFPKNVAFLDPLPVVPAFDDAPEDPVPTRPRKKPVVATKPADKQQPTPEVKTPEAQPEPATSVRGRVLTTRALGSGTQIVINKGSTHGVAEGWKGAVINDKGRPILNGEFTITRVTPIQSTAIVRASLDAVKQAGNVRMQAP